MAEIAQQARRGYRAVRRSNHLETLTRIGFLSKGVVYLLLGSLAVMAALHKGGQTTDQKGVIQFIAGKPFGELALSLDRRRSHRLCDLAVRLRDIGH